MPTVNSEPVTFHDYYPAANGRGVHALDTQTVRAVLTSTVPAIQSDTVLTNLTQVANGNGYTTDGVTCTITPPTHAGGIWRLVPTAIPQWTASGAGFSFRSLVLVNWSATNKNLILAVFQSAQGFLTVTNVAQSGTTATITAAGHGWANGDTVVLDAIPFSRLNGTFAISGVTTNTFNITAPVSATITSQAVASGRVIRPALVTLAANETYQAAADPVAGALAVGPRGVTL